MIIRKLSILIGIILFNSILFSANQVVTSNADSGAGTLRQALIDVGDGDEITFNLSYSNEVITVFSALQTAYGKGLTIDGDNTMGSGNDVTVQVSNPGVSSYPVFNIGSQTELVTIKNMIIKGGDAGSGSGGAIQNGSYNPLTLENCTIQDGAGRFGGGLYFYASTGRPTLTINNCVFQNNTAADHGCGARIRGATVVMSNTVFDNNDNTNSGTGNYWGGGIYFYDCDVTIDNCTFKNNLAGNSGGGIYGSYQGTGTLVLTNSTFHNNGLKQNAGGGGGLYWGAGNAQITNCTFTNNSAYWYGGGIYLSGSGDTHAMTNVTVAENTLGYGSYNAEGVFISSATLNIKNCLIANNSDGDFDNSGGTINDNGYNIIETGDIAEFDHAQSITGNQTNLWGTGNQTTPLLADNSTLNNTQTLALASGSVAIDVGDASANGSVSVPTLDQRGLYRNGNTDIGAYEFGGTSTPPASPTVTTTSVSSVTSTTATSGGNVTSNGGASVTARGVCWSTSNNPTTADSKTTDGTGTGSFTSNITGLSEGTAYYVRAYATNSIDTSYGDEESFTTDTKPSVTTTSVSSVTSTTATSGGNVTSNGGASVTARGVCWSTSNNPTTADSKTTDGTGTGSFTSSITGLTAGNTYYVRAYATNSVGTEYGGEESFSTAKPEINLKQSTTAIADSGSYDFGSRVLGTNSDIIFTIENTGTSDLTITTPITISGTDANQFSMQSQPISPIAKSGSTTFTIRFTPTTTGSKTATMSIVNNDDDENPYDLVINGTGQYGTVKISGIIRWSETNAPIEGITVSFSNSGGQAVKTDNNGYYEVHLGAPYTGVATPSSTYMYGAGVDYSPASRSYTNISAKQENQDYLGSPQYATISGYFKDNSGMPIEGFDISFDNGGNTYTTDSNGYYEAFVKWGWSGTATPSKAGWTCSPDKMTYTNVHTNYNDQDYTGQFITLGAEDDLSTIPDEFTILPAYPNPFNPSTTIAYGLDENSIVTIAIYNLSGNLITTLLSEEQPQGWHTFKWNGTDQHNNQVPAGIYLSRITSNNTTKTSKLMLLK